MWERPFRTKKRIKAEQTKTQNNCEKIVKKQSVLSFRSDTISHIADEADKKEGGFRGSAGRIRTLPCNEIGEIVTSSLRQMEFEARCPEIM